MIDAKLKLTFVNSCNLGMLFLLMTCFGCGQKSQTFDLEFVLQQPNQNVTNVAFYISDVQVYEHRGQAHPVQFQNGQNNNHIALLALNNKTRQQHLKARVNTTRDLQGLGFTLGVPQALNHHNPLTAVAPLNDSAMFWSWQQGYKFLRIDAEAPQKWAFHLGSTGCRSPSSFRPPETPCDQSNRVQVNLPEYVPGSDAIIVDLTALTAEIAHHQNVNCTMNFNQQKICTALLNTLALDANTGRCVNNCAAQTLFTVK